MPKNSFLKALFPRLKYSLSPIDKRSKGTVKIGKIVPVYYTMLNGKESVNLNLAHLLRFMPTTAPVMEGYKVTFDAFAVPLTALAYAQRKERDIIDFHNLAENGGTVPNPFSHNLGVDVAPVWHRDGVEYEGDPASSAGRFFMPESLGDYLNFPSMKAFRDYVRSWIARTPLFDGDFASRRADLDANDDGLYLSVSDFVARFYLSNDIEGSPQAALDGSGRGHGVRYYFLSVPFVASSSVALPSSYSDWTDTGFYQVNVPVLYGDNIDFYGESSPADISTDISSLLKYVFENYPLVADYYDFNANVTTWLNNLYVRAANDNLNLNYLEILYQLYKVDAQTVFDSWFESEVMPKLLFNGSLFGQVHLPNDSWSTGGTLMSNGWLPDLTELDPVDFSYFAAYWKIISDWYINTNIDGNPDEFFLKHCYLLPGSDYDNPRVDIEPFERRWNNDIFTSAVPSSAADDIKIPVENGEGGTIPELREANAYQRLKDILRNVGNRAKDVMYGIRGYTPTAQASEMSLPVGTLTAYMGMQSILQTSQTTIDSAQASYSGIATSAGQHKHLLKVINTSDPCPVIVMVLMSVTEESSYMQGFDRRLFRTSIYDFAIPELANVGEQAVYTKELYFDYEPNHLAVENDEIWAFNRRYYDWFYEANEVHGEMRDSLDYWHGTRIFDSKPALNSQFIGINSELDHLNRVFANMAETASPIVYNLSFEGEKIVSLPRYIQYEL